MEAANPSAAPVRVLARPSPPSRSISASSPSPSHSNSPLNQSAPSPPPAGVVVVGFLGTADASDLINRILDASVFGSGNLDKDLLPSDLDAISGKDWFERRRISYHHDEEKGLVFLHFSSSSSLLDSSRFARGECDELASILEEREADDLRGMLFMFLVCHVIIYLQDGMRFDTNILKKLRILQAAKHALGPFIRSQIVPKFAPKVPPSPLKATVRNAASVSPPSRRGPTGRHASAISLMSGSGSCPAVLPGQCTPVILFVFHDDFLESSGPAPNGEDSADVSSLNQSLSSVGAPKPGLTLKGSGPVMMLTRPINKTEGSFRKKLQSSLEAQVRVLIKKCRTLVGTDSSHLGFRGAPNANSLPLFSLDPSRLVALLDREISHRGESLNFVTSLIEDALDSKTALDMVFLENQCQNVHHEDLQVIKDFVYRLSDALRGRGGLPSNANSGSVAGVGMVAAAAAAAAASAAAGKPISTPELLSLENWLSSSSLVLGALISVKDSFGEGNENFTPKRTSVETQDEKSGKSAMEAATSLLESRKGLNKRFSVSWCQKALPAAKEVYLKDLPACYPTALHKTQLEKALQAFHSMVKGPAVGIFAERLENECVSIWESGRQLCDAVSLTGKPCMHQRHNVESSNSPLEAVVEQHCSGFVFLHACGCGRSRRIRDDPFDFESANVIFNRFANCEDLLPTLAIPKGTSAGPLPHNSWHLVRLGGAKYYKPTKGLLQVGFCSTEKFLLKWTISFKKQNEMTSLPIGVTSKTAIPAPDLDSNSLFTQDKETKKTDAAHVPQVQPGGSANQRKLSEMVSLNNSTISFGKGLPSFGIKKPFSEVVAGTSTNNSTLAQKALPILQQRKQPKPGSEKDLRQMKVGDQTDNQIHMVNERQGSQRSDPNCVQENGNGTDDNRKGNPFLQIGSNIVPVNLSSGGKTKPNNSLTQVVVYIGFEHECSYGHRFLLSPKHLTGLGSQYMSSDNSHSSAEDSDRNFAESKSISHEKMIPLSSVTDAKINVKKATKSTESRVNYSQQQDASRLFSKFDMQKAQFVDGRTTSPDFVKDLEGNFIHTRLDDGGPAYSFLNRNLPIYMNCPHCKTSKKDETQKTKFASSVSQLQRIFVVTPPFPTVLATCPVIQFQESCLPASIVDREQQLRFSLGCQVILPPESFITFRLPFVYGVQIGEGNLHPLNRLENQPELTAWLVKGTILQIVSKAHVSDQEVQIQ